MIPEGTYKLHPIYEIYRFLKIESNEEKLHYFVGKCHRYNISMVAITNWLTVTNYPLLDPE
jgi:hypothetical protein